MGEGQGIEWVEQESLQFKSSSSDNSLYQDIFEFEAYFLNSYLD